MGYQSAQQGWNQATAAMQTTMVRGLAGGASSSPGTRRRRRTKSVVRAVTKRVKRRAKGRAAKFVKGSAAAKAHMAKLRRMVDKRR